MQGISILLTGTHVLSDAPLSFPSFYHAITWTCCSAISPWTTLVKVSGIFPLAFFLKLVFFEWSETACSLCCCYGSLNYEVLELWYNHNCNNDDFNMWFIFGNQTEWSLFCYTWRHSSVWFSNVILKTLFQITVQYLLILQKSLQVSQFFKIFCEFICAPDECFCLIHGIKFTEINVFVWSEEINGCKKQIFCSLWKLMNMKTSEISRCLV